MSTPAPADDAVAESGSKRGPESLDAEEVVESDAKRAKPAAEPEVAGEDIKVAPTEPEAATETPDAAATAAQPAEPAKAEDAAAAPSDDAPAAASAASAATISAPAVSTGPLAEEEIVKLVEERERYRAEKNWAEADKVREQLQYVHPWLSAPPPPVLVCADSAASHRAVFAGACCAPVFGPTEPFAQKKNRKKETTRCKPPATEPPHTPARTYRGRHHGVTISDKEHAWRSTDGRHGAIVLGISSAQASCVHATPRRATLRRKAVVKTVLQSAAVAHTARVMGAAPVRPCAPACRRKHTTGRECWRAATGNAPRPTLAPFV